MGSGGTKKLCLGSDSFILLVYEVVFSPKAFPINLSGSHPAALFRLNHPALTSLPQLYSAQMQPHSRVRTVTGCHYTTGQSFKQCLASLTHTEQRGELRDCSLADGCWISA